MHEIIKEAKALYESACKDARLSHIWNDNMGLLKMFIQDAQTPEELNELLDNTDFYAIRPSSPEIKEKMMEWYAQELNKHGWDDSIPSTPNMCKMLLYCIRIRGSMGTPESIVELGGGNGQFASMAKTFGVQNHILIDLPETLYMAYVNLRNTFPKARCLWVTPENTNLNRMAWDFIFIPVGLEGVLEGDQLDLFVNTASLGEMSNSTIEYWFDFVQNRIKVNYLYTMNRFLNTVRRDDIYDPVTFSCKRLNENKASVSMDSLWEIRHWQLDPTINRCPYEDTRTARYVEVFARRQSNKDVSNHDLEALKLQDWWRLRSGDCIGTNLSNQLNHDFTKNGTLFALWDEIRLNPSQEAIRMMMVYLRSLGKPGLAFEEEFFYHDLYTSLFKDNEAFFHKGALC